MKRLLSSVFRTFRVWRERRLLAGAMRKAPQPAPPEGLRERLLDQALAAGRAVSPRPRLSRAWVVWAVPAAVLVVTVIWIAWSSAPRRDRITGVSAARPRGPSARVPRVLPGPREGTLLRDNKVTRIVKPVPPVHRPRMAKSVTAGQGSPIKLSRRRDSLARVRVVEHWLWSGSGVSGMRAVPPMRVTVSRTRKGNIGYAQAAAWDTDTEGHRVRTEWTLVDDSHARVSREELSVTDASGHRQSLRVTLVAASSDGKQPKGEEL